MPAGVVAGVALAVCGAAIVVAPSVHRAVRAWRSSRPALRSVAAPALSPLLPAVSIPPIVGELGADAGQGPAPGPGPASGPVDAARFAAGACVAYPPTGVPRNTTVFLDPGHGGPDPGAIGISGGSVVQEAGATLPTVLAAVPLLQARGYRVVVSRSGSGAVARPGPGDLTGGIFTPQGLLRDSVARAVCADIAQAAVLVSVHLNAGSSPSNAGMLSVYDDARSFSSDSRRLASLLQSDVLAAMNANGWGVPDGGVVSDLGYGAPALDPAGAAYGRLAILGPASPGYIDTPSGMPGVVIEPLFVTDPFEAGIAAGATGQHAIGTGIAKAVDAFLGGGG